MTLLGRDCEGEINFFSLNVLLIGYPDRSLIKYLIRDTILFDNLFLYIRPNACHDAIYPRM